MCTFEVKLNDEETVGFRFQHDHGRVVKGDFKYYNCPEEKIPDGTSCFLFQNGKYLAKIKAFLNPNENFVRYRGRKYSLAKLINRCDFTQEERTKIWEAYFKKFPNDKRR